MTYESIQEGVFLRRPNQFTAEVEIDGKATICHVKNTGRCKELLIPGTKVYLNEASNPARATKYDLVSVAKAGRLVNIDSQAPNRVFEEYLRQGGYIPNISLIRPERKYVRSRFDFYVEARKRKIYIEVKGVTLEENNVVMFPDAPTERGVKHLNELVRCIADGYEAHVVFIIQMQGVSYFTPNYNTHHEFGSALANAINNGVKADAFDCVITPCSVSINDRVPIQLNNLPFSKPYLP
jgi:sugar fermentation stimulation protein A